MPRPFRFTSTHCAWGIAQAIALVVTVGSAAAQTTPAPAAASTAPAPGSVMVAGYAFEPEVNLAGKTIKLNGTGIRTRAFFKVYAAGLYLPIKAKTPQEVYAAPAPKRLKVTMLREIDSASFGKTMSQVMGDNLPRDQLGKCIPGLLKLGEVFAAKKKMVAGDWYTLDEIAGKGTVLTINGTVTAEVAEPEFFTCLMHNYFGDKPADTDLKAGLLGK
jgi:Chalcone isomerase-like